MKNLQEYKPNQQRNPISIKRYDFLPALFWTLIAFLFASRVGISLTHHNSLIYSDLYLDDAFYYLKIAKNFVETGSLSFDGEIPTNGFQPLYFIQLLPIMWFSKGDLILPIHLSMILLATWSTLTGILIYKLMKKLTSSKLALTALALFSLSPYFINFGINGLETGLAWFFAVALIFFYERWFLDIENLTPIKKILFGILCGLAPLARIDLSFLVVALLFDAILRNQKLGLKNLLGTTVLVALFSLITWSSWACFSLFHTGKALPQSGKAGKEIALNYGFNNLDKIWTDAKQPPLFDTNDTPLSFYQDVASKFFLTFLFENPLLFILRANIPFDNWSEMKEFSLRKLLKTFPKASTTLMLIFMGIGIFKQRHTKTGSTSPKQSKLNLNRINTLFVFLAISAYTFLGPIHWYANRYVSTLILTTFLAMLHTAHHYFFTPINHRPIFRTFFWIYVLLGLSFQTFHLNFFSILRWNHAEPGSFWAAYLRKSTTFRKNDRIGIFQSGMIAYLSNRSIINLDGKVNPEAYRALKNKTLHEYIKKKQLDYLLDEMDPIVFLCLRHDQKNSLKLKPLSRPLHRYDTILFEVENQQLPRIKKKS